MGKLLKHASKACELESGASLSRRKHRPRVFLRGLNSPSMNPKRREWQQLKRSCDEPREEAMNITRVCNESIIKEK